MPSDSSLGESQRIPCENTGVISLRRHQLVAFRKQLLAWFRKHQRDLPWRRARDPYRIWLSEIMLQQTRVAAVVPYYERFLARFPDVNALAQAPEEEVLRLWSGLGYYSRARNLQQAAQQIVAKHNGVFPKSEKDALALPGIGRYTASAILSIAFGAKHAVLDGNVARLLARLFAIQGDLHEGKRWQSLQTSAGELLDAKSPGDWNQAMMELGATLCTPRAPQCLLCPIAQFCRARKLGLAESLPAIRQKRATVDITLAAAVLLDDQGHTLLLPPPHPTRKSTTHHEVAALVSKMWHFPTLAVRESSAAELQDLLRRLLPAKLPGKCLQLEPLPKVRHTVTYRKISVEAFLLRITKLPELSGTTAILLTDLCSPSSLAVSNLTRKVARAALAKRAPEPAPHAALSFRAASA
jgi:A/G-specific adenine glycosylase